MRVLTLSIAVTLALASAATAQLPGRRGGAAGGSPRQELEADMRRAFARVVRVRVGLTDDQMQKLGPMTERHAIARRRLQMDERATRLELQAVLSGPNPADSTVERLLNRFTEIQKQRVELMESEQKDLATIMTPVQRARFAAMQEQLRRQLDQRRGGPPPMGGAGGDRPPPRGRRPPP